MSPAGRLLGAVVVSAAAHGALLLGVLASGRPPRTAAVTSVRLVELAFEPTPAASVEAAAAPRRREPSRPRAALVARSEVTPSPASDGEQGPPAPGAEDGASPGTRGGGEGASPAREGGGAGSGGGVDPRLAELHRRLAEAAARCYPPAAQRLRLQGEVPLRFCLDAHGGASGLSLLGTTGSALLDRSALECVVPGAEPLPALAGCFQVAVRFGG